MTKKNMLSEVRKTISKLEEKEKVKKQELDAITNQLIELKKKEKQLAKLEEELNDLLGGK